MIRPAIPPIAATVLIAGGLAWVAVARGRAPSRRKGSPRAGARTVFPDPLPPPTDTTGLIPLTDLGTQTYKGEDGGLYGGGSNEPPPVHRAAVLREVEQIRPLDVDGKPDADGKIGFISVGMSNTTMESRPSSRRLTSTRSGHPGSWSSTVRRAVVAPRSGRTTPKEPWCRSLSGGRPAAAGGRRQPRAGAGRLDQARGRRAPHPGEVPAP